MVSGDKSYQIDNAGFGAGIVLSMCADTGSGYQISSEPDKFFQASSSRTGDSKVVDGLDGLDGIHR